MKTCRYLESAKNIRMVSNTYTYKGLEFFVDADFAGNWQSVSKDYPENCLLRTGLLSNLMGVALLGNTSCRLK